MIAYKFLRAGRRGPFTGFAWPRPGVWVRAGGATDPCRRGVHACALEDLPWWLADELWDIELDGEPQRHGHKLVAPAGCLRSRVDSWTPACAQEYAEACAWRARDHAVEALVRGQHTTAAGEVEACATLDELLEAARRLAGHVADSRISLTIAGDGAARALGGAAPTSAYIAAHAALRLHGHAGYAAERAWQSDWLAVRLGLRNESPPARTTVAAADFKREEQQ